MALAYFSSSSLKAGFSKAVGRNSGGHITSKHRGGGSCQKYRRVGGIGLGFFTLVGFEYDPYRSAVIAVFLGGSPSALSFVLKVRGFFIGACLAVPFLRYSSIDFSVKTFLFSIRVGSLPVGSFINGLEGRSSSTALVRSAGCQGQIVYKALAYACVRLPSGSLVFFNSDRLANLGGLFSSEASLGKLKKAGENRWRGCRPSVRGVAINPVDHPHGGGEGKSSGGRPSVSPWGLLAKGKKTKA